MEALSMIRKAFFLVAVFAFGMPGFLSGGERRTSFFFGNNVLEICSFESSGSNDGSDPTYCMGYIAGVVDAIRGVPLPDDMPTHCLPPNVTLGQLRQVVVKYLEDHPEKLHYSGDAIILAALAEAFPCN